MDSGDENLSNLLNNLQPNLLNEDYVFITLEDYSFDFFNLLHPIATFKEKEGLTLVITEERAKQEKNRLAQSTPDGRKANPTKI